MKWLQRALRTVAAPALIASAALASGCVKNDISLTIQRFLQADSGTCTASATGMVGLAGGVLDVGLMADAGFPGYIAFPLISNNLPENTSTTMVELNAITVTGLNIKLSGSNINFSQPSFFLQAAGGRIIPAGLVTFGAEILPRSVGIELAKTLPEASGGAIFPTIDVQVSPVGTRSGDTLVGAPVTFPIQVCKHCLSPAPTACPAGGFRASSVQAGGCFTQEDQSVTCCTEGSTLLCGSQVPQNMSTSTDL